MQHPLECNTFQIHTSLSLDTHKMVNEQDMEKALAELESSKKPNYTVTAKKYKLVLSTLIRHT